MFLDYEPDTETVERWDNDTLEDYLDFAAKAEYEEWLAGPGSCDCM